MTAMQLILLEALVVEGFTGLSLVDQSAGKLPITMPMPATARNGRRPRRENQRDHSLVVDGLQPRICNFIFHPKLVLKGNVLMLLLYQLMHSGPTFFQSLLQVGKRIVKPAK